MADQETQVALADEAPGTRRLDSASHEGLAELRGWIERLWDDAAADPAPARKRRGS